MMQVTVFQVRSTFYFESSYECLDLILWFENLNIL